MRRALRSRWIMPSSTTRSAGRTGRRTSSCRCSPTNSQPARPDPQRVEVLRQKSPNPASRRPGARDVIDLKVGQMVRLVDDLLDVSANHPGQDPPRSSESRRPELVAHGKRRGQPPLEARQEPARRILPADTVSVDEIRATCRSSTNLLNNAAKYTTQAGPPDARRGRGPRKSVFRIRDTGSASRRYAARGVRTVHPGDQFHSTALEGGLGIGLTLVRRLVEKHGGAGEGGERRARPRQ